MNGTVYPYLEVEPRRYRFRILNACGTRFLSLRLLKRSAGLSPIALRPIPQILGPR